MSQQNVRIQLILKYLNLSCLGFDRGSSPKNFEVGSHFYPAAYLDVKVRMRDEKNICDFLKIFHEIHHLIC